MLRHETFELLSAKNEPAVPLKKAPPKFWRRSQQKIKRFSMSFGSPVINEKDFSNKLIVRMYVRIRYLMVNIGNLPLACVYPIFWEKTLHFQQIKQKRGTVTN